MEHLRARQGVTVYCNACLQRWFLIFEPDFAKGEEDQVKPAIPRFCPFCGEQEGLEQEGGLVTDARVLSEETLRSWRTS